MLGVRIGLRQILALNVHALEFASDRRGVEHVRNTKTGFRVKLHAPALLEGRPRLAVVNRTVTR